MHFPSQTRWTVAKKVLCFLKCKIYQGLLMRMNLQDIYQERELVLVVIKVRLILLGIKLGLIFIGV